MSHVFTSRTWRRNVCDFTSFILYQPFTLTFSLDMWNLLSHSWYKKNLFFGFLFFLILKWWHLLNISSSSSWLSYKPVCDVCHIHVLSALYSRCGLSGSCAKCLRWLFFFFSWSSSSLDCTMFQWCLKYYRRPQSHFVLHARAQWI